MQEIVAQTRIINYSTGYFINNIFLPQSSLRNRYPTEEVRCITFIFELRQYFRKNALVALGEINDEFFEWVYFFFFHKKCVFAEKSSLFKTKLFLRIRQITDCRKFQFSFFAIGNLYPRPSQRTLECNSKSEFENFIVFTIWRRKKNDDVNSCGGKCTITPPSFVGTHKSRISRDFRRL